MGRKMDKIQKLTINCIVFISFSSAIFTDELKDIINSKKDSFEEIAIDIWNYAELGYLETKSSNLLASELKNNGFIIQKGVAGIPTSFIAEFNNGGPVIGILGEFDALPGLAQTNSPFKEIANNETVLDMHVDIICLEQHLLGLL